MRKLALFVFSCVSFLFSWAQTEVTGRVTGAEGNPLSGITVSVKGKPGTTATDNDGRFRIQAATNDILVFSGVGFDGQEVAVTGSTVDILLQASNRNLQEVVVTGYSIQNKRQVTGSISRVTGDEIKMQPIGSFDKALQGKVPGLLAQSQSGQPGSAAVVTIRGKGSINGTNTPLYILDGVQVNAADFATINPADIESYNVLKDASSTAIYGSRGANGVIVVTTKKGVAGRTKVNYDFQYGYSELPPTNLDLMNSEEKLNYELYYDRPDYGRNPFGWTNDEVDSLRKVNHNITKSLFRKGITQQHNLSASGGNERTHFYLSGSYFDQQGIVKTTGLKRYTGRANIDNTFGHFKVGINTTFGYSRLVNTNENDQYVGSPLNAINWFNPYLGLYDEEGAYQNDYLQGQPNPLRELLETKNYTDQLKAVGNVYAEFNVPWVKGLRARTLWGGDFTQDELFLYDDRSTDQGSQAIGGNGQVQRRVGKTFRYTGTTSLGYQNRFGEHEINVAVFNEIVRSKGTSFGFRGFGLVGPFKNEAGITPGTPTNGYIPVVAGNGTENALLSYFIDGTYGFRSKYYLSFGARRDGSSRLSEDVRFANFGQVGLSWLISEEDALNDLPWLNSLKYKVSYGSVGSQGIGDFTTRELLSATAYNGVGGLVLTNLQRPLTWERKVIFNTGIEFTLFKGRMGGTIEYYNAITKDLFLDRQLSRTTGFASITNNLGRLQNQGIELSLSGTLINSRNFKWSVEGNYTYNRNKLLEQPGQEENINGIYINKVGHAINSIYVVKYAGVDSQTGDALYYKKDGKNTTNIYDPEDRVLVGSIDPPHFGGFSNTFNYKGLSLDVLFSYAYGNHVYNNDRVNVENPIYWYSNLSSSLMREWQVPGDITDIPSSFNDLQAETTRFVEKGDYLRLRNVMLSYSLTNRLTQRMGVQSIRFFAQGQNLKVWHNFQGYDPEITTGILGGAQYPQLRTISFGVNLGL
jgi:TonB-linked SusC/RagA family outer membrane protein